MTDPDEALALGVPVVRLYQRIAEYVLHTRSCFGQGKYYKVGAHSVSELGVPLHRCAEPAVESSPEGSLARASETHNHGSACLRCVDAYQLLDCKVIGIVGLDAIICLDQNIGSPYCLHLRTAPRCRPCGFHLVRRGNIDSAVISFCEDAPGCSPILLLYEAVSVFPAICGPEQQGTEGTGCRPADKCEFIHFFVLLLHTIV